MESEGENSQSTTNAQAGPSSGENGVKKRRLQNACDECRKRKIRCDSAKMQDGLCTNCKYFKTECTHVMTKRKRGPPKGTPRGKKTIKSIVSSILSASKPYEIPEDSSAVYDLLVDLAKHIWSLEEELEQAKREIELLTSGKSSSGNLTHVNDEFLATCPRVPDSSSSFNSLEDLSFELRYLRIKDDYSSRHFGQSSSRVLVKNALNLKKEYTGEHEDVSPDPGHWRVTRGIKRSEFWAVYPWQLPPPSPQPPLIFPDPDLLQTLINLYFTHVNIYIPILHRPTFERSISQNQHVSNRSFGYVVLAVCAIAARYSNDPRVYLEGSASGHSAGWKWFRQVKLIKSELFLDPPCLYDVQLYSLYVIFMNPTSTSETSWILVSLGIRLAQDVGAHRRRSDFEKVTVESELWKRAFWALFVLDVFSSTLVGRPRALPPEDFDIDLPIECDDEYWESEDGDITTAFTQPPGKPSTVSAYISLLKLLDILAMSQRTIYGIRRAGNAGTGDMSVDKGVTLTAEWNQKAVAVAELESKLAEWMETLPEHLKFDPNRENMDYFNQSVVLHITYYWIQIQIRKPFIPCLSSPAGTNSETSSAQGKGKNSDSTATMTFPSSSPFSSSPSHSLAVCANAARSCCYVMEAQQRRGHILFPDIILTALFNAGVVLTLNVWKGACERAKEQSWENLNDAFSDVYKCMNMIKIYENRWQKAGRLYDIIGELVSFTHLRTSAKRQRDSEDQNLDDVRDSKQICSANSSEHVETRRMAASTRVPQSAGAPPAPPVLGGTGSLGEGGEERSGFTLHVHSNGFSNSLPAALGTADNVGASFNWDQGESTGFSLPEDPYAFGLQPLYGTMPMPISTPVPPAVPSSTFANDSTPLEASYLNGEAMQPGLGLGLGGISNDLTQGAPSSSFSPRLLSRGAPNGLTMGSAGSFFHGPGNEMINPLTMDTSMNMGLNENSEWQDWGSYMADVDELLRTMNSV